MCRRVSFIVNDWCAYLFHHVLDLHKVIFRLDVGGLGPAAAILVVVGINLLLFSAASALIRTLAIQVFARFCLHSLPVVHLLSWAPELKATGIELRAAKARALVVL